MGSGMEGRSYISDRDGNPNVFKLEHNDDGLWLNDNWANPTNRWNPDNEFVFRLRKYLLSRAYKVRFFFSGFSKLFFQPPNILPISSNLSAISSYCLWEISFASHATEIKNLRISKIYLSFLFFSA